jgi:hypothetical protein
VGSKPGSNPLYVFDAIFGWDHQPQRCAVLKGKGRSIHFVAQESLRVERTCHINSHVIFLARGSQTHISRVHRIRRELYAEIWEPGAVPVDDITPPLNSVQLCRLFDFGERLDFVQGHAVHGPGDFIDVEPPLAGIALGRDPDESICSDRLNASIRKAAASLRSLKRQRANRLLKRSMRRNGSGREPSRGRVCSQRHVL